MVVHTAGSRIICMSISGALERDSRRYQKIAMTMETAIRPRVLPEPQPHIEPSLTASSRQTSQPRQQQAAEDADRTRRRTADSGIDEARRRPRRCDTTIIGIQKSQW